MRRTKKMLALLLAGVLTFSNVAYAAPGDGGSAPTENEAETDISIPQNEGAEALEMGSETDPEDEVKDLETEPEGEVTDPETDPEGEVTDPETDPEGEVTDPETDPEGEVTDPETDPEGEVTDPETDPEGEVTDPETDPEDEVKDPETDPEDEGKDPEVVDDVDAAGAAEEDPENSDADAAEEVTEDEEESEEAVTYKITFAEEPESHGTLLTIDDEEIGEEGIETDEEGYAQFKVQADEGWTAEAVCGDEVLSLVEDSYYEVQVSEDTEVTVSYQEAAVEEEPLPEVVEEPEAVTEDEELEAPMVFSMARMLELYADETIEVTIDGVDGQSTYDLPVGTIADHVPDYPNYTYEYATLGEDGQRIIALGVYVIGDTTYKYYSTDGSSAQLIGNNEIVLHYSKTPLSITYKVGPEENIGTVNGPSQATAGENVEFTISPALGYEVDTVSVGEENLEPSAIGVYSFTMPEAETEVNISLKKAASYTVTLKPLGNSANYDQHSLVGRVCHETQLEYTVDNGGTATFIIYTDDIRSGGINKPFDYITINGQRVDLNNGECSGVAVGDMTVSAVRHNDCGHGISNYYYYTVTITNVQQDLEIGYLIRGENGIADRNVTITEMSDGIRVYVKAPDKDFTEASLNDSFVFEDEGQRIYFYVAVEPGYEGFDLGGINHEHKYESIDKAISDGYTQAEYAKSLGCQYAFVFTRHSGDNKDRTVTLNTNPLKYTVNYDTDGGAGGSTDPGKYTVQTGSNIITVSDTEPTKENCVFVGWKLGDNIYTSGDQITVDSNLLPLAGEDRTFTFVAQWVDADSVANYTVEYYKETAIGEYPLSPELRKEFKNATVGETAVANATPADLDISGYVLDYDKSILTGKVTDDDALVLKVFYALDTNNNGTPDKDELVTLTFESTYGFEDEEGTRYTLKDQVPGLAFQAPIPKDTNTDNVVFVGWTEGLAKNGEGKVPESNTTYVAQYKDDKDNDDVADYEQYQLTYNGNEAESGTVPTDSDYYSEGEKATLAGNTGNLTKSGAAFAGWSKTKHTETVSAAPADLVDEVTFGDEDITVYAVWATDSDKDGKPDYEQYQLTYNGNEAESGTVPTDSDYYSEGEKATLAGNTGNLTKSGAAFAGWSKTKHTETVSAAPADLVDEVTFGDEDITVYAVWAIDENNNGQPDYEEPLVNITFDVVDTTKGYFETAGRRTITVELLPGIELPTPSSFVDVEGDEWTLDGWMNNGQEVTVVPDTNATVLAHWAEDKNQNNEPDVDEEWVSITFDAVDTARGYFGNGEQTRTFKMLPGAPLLSPAGFVDVLGDNWTLDYWTLNGQEVTVVPNTDATVLAHWAEDTNHNNQPDEDESYSLTITYAYAQGEEGSAALPAVNRQNDLAVGHAYSVASPEIEGYVAVPAVVSGTISDRDVSATVLYYIDSNGNDVPDSQEPDDGGNGGGGGSSDEDDDDGGSGGTGGGTTGGGTAADTTTGTGTTPGAGTGAVPAPVTTVTIAADDADAADTADDADAAEGADEDYALEEVGEDTENAAEDEESVATINEDETPLANQQIHSPVCILHWLILLAALIIAVIFIWDGHNRKKRIEELKKELGMK